MIPGIRFGSIFAVFRLCEYLARLFAPSRKTMSGRKKLWVGDDVKNRAIESQWQQEHRKTAGGRDICRILIAGIIAIFTSATASSAGAEKVYYLHDPGGNVAAHIYTYSHVNEEYDRVVIDGQCKSACTTVLGVVPLNKICIAPSGYFMFHAAHNRDRSFNAGLTQLMMQTYAPEVRDWVMRHHALDQVDPYTYLYPRNVTFIRRCRR